MSLIYSYQLYVTESIDLHSASLYNLGPIVNNFDVVHKKYVDDLFQTIVTSSNSFIALSDTPKTYNKDRILFEGTSSVIDHSNFRFQNNDLLNVTGSAKFTDSIYLGLNSTRIFETSANVIKVDGSFTVAKIFKLEKITQPFTMYSSSVAMYYSASGASPNQTVGLYMKMENGDEVVVSSRIV